MSLYRVIATDKVSKKGLAPLQEDDMFEVLKIPDSAGPEFAAALPEASGLIVRSTTKVGATLLDAAPRLKVVGRAGVGIDNIDLAAASERGIAVLNAPGGNTVSAAELTVALILSVARHLPNADRSVREGRWDRAKFRGIELRGKLLGLIGAGRIGAEVAVRCRAFGMHVIANDPYIPLKRAKELRLDLTDFDYLIENSDVISLHVPLTSNTRGLIDESALSRMKKRAILINASRGGVVDEVALVKALADGRIAGAGLDVFESEPIPPNSPLLLAPNMVLTPHLGASTREAQVQVAHDVAVGIHSVLAHGDISEAINAAEIARAAGLS